ncbi:hypothetical protein EMCRGX_G010676 [Ephydatia muelleri]
MTPSTVQQLHRASIHTTTFVTGSNGSVRSQKGEVSRSRWGPSLGVGSVDSRPWDGWRNPPGNTGNLDLALCTHSYHAPVLELTDAVLALCSISYAHFQLFCNAVHMFS